MRLAWLGMMGVGAFETAYGIATRSIENAVAGALLFVLAVPAGVYWLRRRVREGR